jgi:hypothetical protein
MKKYYTFIRIFGATGPPHLLPKYVPDKLLAREIAYQTVEKGATSYLSREKKRYWPIFPLHIGQFSLLNKNKMKRRLKPLRNYVYVLQTRKGMTLKIWCMTI